MAVVFRTAKPKTLLKSFEDRISQENPEGKITTWEKSGDYYSHKAAQWAKKAFFLPRTADGELVFNIVRPKEKGVSTTVYGYYHGHLIETFLNHFDEHFTSASASAKATSPDNVTNK